MKPGEGQIGTLRWLALGLLGCVAVVASGLLWHASTRSAHSNRPGTEASGLAPAFRTHDFPEVNPPGFDRLKEAANSRWHGGSHGSFSPQASGPPSVAATLGINGQSDPNWTPSDSTVAVSPTRVVEWVNERYGVYDKSLSLKSSGTLPSITGQGSTFDPQVIWDGATNRFYFFADTQVNAGNGNYGLAYGFSKTPSGTTWCSYNINYGTTLPDQPKIGDTKHFWFAGINQYPNGKKWSDTRIVSAQKPPKGKITTCPTVPAATSNAITNSTGSLLFNASGVRQDDPGTKGYAITNDAYLGSTNLELIAMRETSTGLSVNTVAKAIPIGAFTFPADAPQPNGRFVDTIDPRTTLSQSAIDPRFGANMIWTTFNAGGDAGSQVDWFEVNPSTLAVAQQGTAADPGLYVFNGAIAPDRVVQGSTTAFGSNMVLIYSTSSGTATPAVVAVSKIGAGAQSAPVTLKTSSGSDIDFTCSGVGSTCRWGDYAGAVSDIAAPANGDRGRDLRRQHVPERWHVNHSEQLEHLADRAHTLGGRRGHVRLRPAGEFHQGGAEGCAALGEPVDGGDRRPAQHLTADQTGALELTEASREHPLGDAGDGGRHLAEPGRPLQQGADDDARPALAEEREHARQSFVAADRIVSGLVGHGPSLPVRLRLSCRLLNP
jgi:hypothetical protein